jgi:uncharacterized membrane protein
MNTEVVKKSNTVAKFAILATVVALIGVIDAAYLTYKHYTHEPVPCSVTGGCEAVLTSSYAEIAGIPLAVFGLLAYLSAFSLSLLTSLGKTKLWNLFGLQVFTMVCFSSWLVYLQIYIIKEICQYCMLSAGVCFTLFTIFIISKILKK